MTLKIKVLSSFLVADLKNGLTSVFSMSGPLNNKNLKYTFRSHLSFPSWPGTSWPPAVRGLGGASFLFSDWLLEGIGRPPLKSTVVKMSQALNRPASYGHLFVLQDAVIGVLQMVVMFSPSGGEHTPSGW